MIIFGTRSYARLLAVLLMVCQHHHAEAPQRVIGRTTKFTLFFIPLFPVSKSYLVECVGCGARTKVTREQADSYVSLAQAAQAAPAVQAPDLGKTAPVPEPTDPNMPRPSAN